MVSAAGIQLIHEEVLLCDTALAVLPDDDLAGRARVLAQRALAESETVGWAAVDAPSAEALRLAECSGSPAAMADAEGARNSAHRAMEAR